MIGFLKGNIEAVYEDRLVLDVNGIGFNICMPQGHLELTGTMGSEIKLYTYLAVREDSMQLYGFMTSDSLDLFKLLIQVNGIGPKGALALLSVMSTDDLRFAIMSGDAKSISKAPGIGAKTAQRLIIDLKDKVSVRDMLDSYSVNSIAYSGSPEDSNMGEAIEALVALGYSQTDSTRAVRQSGASADDDTETIIKLAFKQLAR